MIPKSDRDVVLIDGVRTPFAKSQTVFAHIHPVFLGQMALRELVARLNLNVDEVDEVIFGNVGNPADAVNISRVIALRSGFNQKISAHTVHRNCASALQSITEGFVLIRSGYADVVVAGGVESMSTIPVLLGSVYQQIFQDLFKAKSPQEALPHLGRLAWAYGRQIWDLLTGQQKSPYFPEIGVMKGLTDPFRGINMGQTAEILAKEWNITRRQQDELALRSHQLTTRAWQEGILAQEVVPVLVPPKYELVSQDVGYRPNQTLEALERLKPFFDKKTGTITAGNASPITDGAAVCLLMSREKAKALGYRPLARVVSFAYAGLEPERMGLGPVYATPLALDRAGLTLKDMDLVEINEAFAAQVLACLKAFDSDTFAQEKLNRPSRVGEIPLEKLNVNGGAIAIGHPVGATGTRLVVTLAKELKRRQKQWGLVTLCIGGGQGGALILENEG